MALVGVVLGLPCGVHTSQLWLLPPVACGILFSSQGSHPHPLHWKASPLPLDLRINSVSSPSSLCRSRRGWRLNISTVLSPGDSKSFKSSVPGVGAGGWGQSPKVYFPWYHRIFFYFIFYLFVAGVQKYSRFFFIPILN